MKDLISRQAAKDAFTKATGDGDKVEFCWGVLDSVPTIDPAENGGCWGCQCDLLGQAPVKHGKWQSTDDGWDGIYYVCSECGCPWTLIDGTPYDNGMNYCPNCGARMKGGEK